MSEPNPTAHRDDAGEPIVRVQRDGVHYTLLGTAHVSRKSVDTVRRMLEQNEYDAVAVELCENRHQALTGADRWRDMDLFRILKEGKAGMVMASLALSGYQRRIAEQFGIEPGAEMKAAIESADARDLELQLIDRDLATTLKRVYRSVSWWRRLLIVSGLMASSFSSEEIAEDEIEKLKQGDLLESTFNEFAEQTPEIYESLIAERDRFMASRLRQQNDAGSGRSVLAVIGAGHLKGLARALENDTTPPLSVIDELNEIPKKAWWPKLIPWLILALILTGFAIGFYRSPELGWKLVATWVLINGTLAAVGAAVARGHPLTVLSGFLAAPVTSLNPTVAAGMVTGLIEAWLRKPTMADLEQLRGDVTRLAGWYKNPVTRVLMVFFFSNLGSAIGTWVAGFRIFERLT